MPDRFDGDADDDTGLFSATAGLGGAAARCPPELLRLILPKIFLNPLGGLEKKEEENSWYRNVAGGCSSGFSELSKAPRVLATNRGKVIEQRDANPCKDGNALAIGCESEGRGFESW